MAETYANLWTNTAALLTSVPNVRGVAPTVKRSKVEAARELLENLPVLGVVIGDDPDSSQPFATGGWQDNRYVVQFVVIAGSNRDVEAGGSDLLDVRAYIRDRFARPEAIRALVPEVLQVEILGKAPISKAAFLKGYDYSALAVRFRCVEQV